jgi:DNA-binding NarL/FixJ family response regulator
VTRMTSKDFMIGINARTNEGNNPGIRHQQFGIAITSGEPREKGVKLSKLTPRELEIIQHLSWGESSKQIAHRLQISCRTVETHRANSMRKLNLHSVTELLHFAFANNLIVIETTQSTVNSLLGLSQAL